MLATLISVIILIVLTTVYNATVLGFFPILALAVGILILLITPLIRGLTLLPVQAASVDVSSRSLNLLRRDPLQNGLAFFWIAFALFSLIVSAFGGQGLFVIWVIWFGLSLDAIFVYTWRATGFSDPFYLIAYFGKKALSNVSPGKQKELSFYIDLLAEISLKSLYQKSLPVSTEGVVALENVAKEYLLSVKGDRSDEARDRVNYTLGFLHHRLQMLFNQAAEDRLEPLANQIVLSTSKITLAVAEYNTAAASLPLHFLDSFFETAREYDLHEVNVNSSIILFEVARSLIASPETRDKHLGGILFSLIEQMEELAKTTFKEDKSTPISLLAQPFEDLKFLLEEEVPEFPESKEVAADLQRVLVEFQALQSVLQTIPDIPGYSKKEEE